MNRVEQSECEGNHFNTITLFDQTFGITPVAFQVAYGLGELEIATLPKEQAGYIANARIETFPFYNCRERGIGLSVNIPGGGKTLVVVWGECRNSDSIVLDSWTLPHMDINPPTIADFTDQAYKARKSFDPDEIGKAVDAIRKIVHDYILAEAKSRPGKKERKQTNQ